MRSILFCVLMGFFLVGSILGQGGVSKGNKVASVEEEKAAVLKIEDANNKARLRGDASVLGKIYADDFVGINAAGGKTDKANIVRFYSKDGSVMSICKTDEVVVRIMGTAAMVTARLEYQYNKSMDNQAIQWLRYTRIFEKKAGEWVIVAEHFSFTDAPSQ